MPRTSGARTMAAFTNEEATMTTHYARARHRPGAVDVAPVTEAMHRGVVSCRADASLATVARLLAGHRIHAVIVEQEAGEWGMVSDLDLVGAVVNGSFADASAGQIATTATVHVRPSDSVGRAAQLMREYDTHHVLVVESGRPVGIVSTLDVADVLAELRS
jgi:CBS domain-containing protein